MEIPEGLDEETRQELQYLLEVLEDYRRYVKDIGKLELAAPNLLYYRDEVQEGLTELEGRVELREVWREVVELDNKLRARASDVVMEIGHANFKQYQIINDPPLTHWWWFLNRTVAAPMVAPNPPAWQFWKR